MRCSSSIARPTTRRSAERSLPRFRTQSKEKRDEALPVIRRRRHGPRRRPCRHAEEDQGQRQRDRGHARVLGRPGLHARRRQVRGLSLRRLRQRPRRHPEATRRGQARHQVPARDLAEPDPAGAERHRRHRMRLDHQQRDAPEGRRLRRDDVRRGSAHRGQGVVGDRQRRRPEGQDRRHDHRHDVGADCCASTSAPKASSSPSCSARTTPTASSSSKAAVPTRS